MPPRTRRLALASACLLLVAAGGFLARRALPTGPPPARAAAGPAKPHFVVSPYLQFATRDGITVRWETSFPGSSVVRYGVGGLHRTATGPKDVTLHEVPLTGLEAGGRYVYQVETV